jgi:methylphosphotriester-DNA--protein-cysteine methyltransferase
MTAKMDPRAQMSSRFIEEIRTLSPTPDPSFEVGRLPNGRTNLVFRELREGSRGELWVAGPNTRATFKRKSGVSRTTIFQFRPAYAVSLLGMPASELTDRVVPLEDVWGVEARQLCEELIVATNPEDAMARVSRVVARRAGRELETGSGQLARRAVALLERGEVRVEQVAERLGVTTRHLRRAFVENVGIGPKDFARTLRLQRAVQLAQTSFNWARVARDAGYYDQAHFIGDFRGLVGLTPAVFFDSSRRSEARSAARLAGVWSIRGISAGAESLVR